MDGETEALTCPQLDKDWVSPSASPQGRVRGDSTALPGTGARLVGRVEGRAVAGRGLPRVGSARQGRAWEAGAGHGARGAAGSAQLGEEARTGLRPQENKQ
ncbi:hypothetical protein P7K49_039300, partial [Saguinus oedipus]